jgi:hypothetical protein
VTEELGLKPMSYSVVVTCLMWLEIPWIRMVKQAIGWLREENLWIRLIPAVVHFSSNLYGRLV